MREGPGQYKALIANGLTENIINVQMNVGTTDGSNYKEVNIGIRNIEDRFYIASTVIATKGSETGLSSQRGQRGHTTLFIIHTSKQP